MRSDGEKSYAFLFQLGYVAKTSRLLEKGPHASGAPALTVEQTEKVRTWIDLELEDRGENAPLTILDKLAGCLDATKFSKIGFETLTTTRRETEDAATCTGCNQAPCSTCHSSDPGSGFMMALGNPVVPAERTFEGTKKTAPPYLQKYLGVSPTGDPVASHAIALKAAATAKDAAYTHPMFTLPPATTTALDAFVDDAIQRYGARACGK